MVTEVPQDRPSMGWWHSMVAREADRNKVMMGERIGNIIGIFFILLFFLILVDVQVSGVGFFTNRFGPLEEVLFYGPLLYGIFPSLLRAFTANKNLGRLADLIGSTFFVVAAIELLYVFPFDFPSLVVYLFGPASGALSWVTNDLARVVIGIGALISAVSVGYNAAKCLAVRKELRARQAVNWKRAQGPGQV